MSSIDERYPSQAVPITGIPDPHETVRTERKASGARGLAWELIQTIVLTLAIFIGVRSVVQNFRVEGASMEPTLHTGQYLLINKAAYFHVDGTPLDVVLPHQVQGQVDYVFDEPQRGDIVVFRAPTQPDKDFIKRMIGLPGDQVLIRAGKVYVNGQMLDEPYIHFPASYNYPVDGKPLTVPEKSYFVLGDNRPNSSDSHLGWFVPVENMVGKAWVSYWPPSEWAVVPHVAYAR